MSTTTIIRSGVLSVTASVKDGYNITHVNSDVQKMIKKEKLIPSGVKVDYGGENEEIMHSMKQMMLMLLVGFILVYLVMVAQFQSLRSPFIVIFTIPLAFTGGMLALLICGQDVSAVSMMGFVMLMGVVVNNAIVLVDASTGSGWKAWIWRALSSRQVLSVCVLF